MGTDRPLQTFAEWQESRTRYMHMMLQRWRFAQAAELHYKRTYAPTPEHLLRLKKPIMPNRWSNFREGWCSAQWGFTNEDLTPYAIEDAAAKLMEVFRNPK